MADVPQYVKEGWRPHGPGLCRCPNCGAVISTNALARARHACPPTQEPNAHVAEPFRSLLNDFFAIPKVLRT